MNFGPNVYFGSERHMANIKAGHFICYLLRYLGVPITVILGSLSGCAGKHVSLSFPPSPTSYGSLMLIQVSPQYPSLWLSCSSSPTCGADPSPAVPVPCDALGSGCSVEPPLCWPHLNPSGCTEVSALRLQFLSPTLSFLKVRNTESTRFSFQIMEGDRNSWPRFLWVDVTTLQRCLSCTYRDVSWLTLTACGIARSQEFADRAWP